jgi:hypothetical protein
MMNIRVGAADAANFGLYGHAESEKTQKFAFRSAYDQITAKTASRHEPVVQWCVSELTGCCAGLSRQRSPVCELGWTMRRRDFISIIGGAATTGLRLRWPNRSGRSVS